jgi:hypothetical protein
MNHCKISKYVKLFINLSKLVCSNANYIRSRPARKPSQLVGLKLTLPPPPEGICFLVISIKVKALTRRMGHHRWPRRLKDKGEKERMEPGHGQGKGSVGRKREPRELTNGA